MFEGLGAPAPNRTCVSRPTRRQRLGSYPAYLSTPRRPSSHPRGFRLIHLSKSLVVKVLRHQPLQVRDVRLFSSLDSPQRSLPGRGRRNLIVRSALVNRPQEGFFTTRSDSQSTRNKPVFDPPNPACARPEEGDRFRVRQYSHTPTRTDRFAASLELFKRCCVKQQATREPQTPQFKSPRPISESLAGVETRPTQRGENIPRPAALSSPRKVFPPVGPASCQRCVDLSITPPPHHSSSGF